MRPQMRVQRRRATVRHEMLDEIEMRDLRQRMHAGIGAAGAVHAHGLAADSLDGTSSAPCTEGRCPASASRRTARRHIR